MGDTRLHLARESGSMWNRGGGNDRPTRRYRQASAAVGAAATKASPRDGTQPPLRSAERSEPACTLLRDESFKAGVKHGRFFAEPTQPARLFQQDLVQIERRSHLHKYAYIVQMTSSQGHFEFF